MKDQVNQKWLEDYENFLQSSSRFEIPKEVKERAFNSVLKLLNPSPLTVFLKIFGIHTGVGYLSLSVCHQFGMNPFNTERSLADWMMRVWGHQVCMIGCGILFVGISLIAAGYFLTIEEIKALKRTELLQTLSLGLISLGLFAAFGAELAFGISVLWLLGGLIGGFFATQAMWRIKRATF